MNRRELLAGAATLAVAPCLPKGLAASEYDAAARAAVDRLAVDMAARPSVSVLWFVRCDGKLGVIGMPVAIDDDAYDGEISTLEEVTNANDT